MAIGKLKLFLKFILIKALILKLKVSSKVVVICDPTNVALLLANFNLELFIFRMEYIPF